eukprot:250757-Chlamydomonas_euryale.AAC.4
MTRHAVPRKVASRMQSARRHTATPSAPSDWRNVSHARGLSYPPTQLEAAMPISSCMQMASVIRMA